MAEVFAWIVSSSLWSWTLSCNPLTQAKLFTELELIVSTLLDRFHCRNVAIGFLLCNPNNIAHS